jgi:hypothetical protein
LFSKRSGSRAAVAVLAAAACILAVAAPRSRASAMPIFAQRYHFRCTVCHSVLPVLNSFGNYFRNHGYRIPNAPTHGTTGAALRYQLEYEQDPPSGQRRWTPAGVLLSSGNVGAITGYLHYNLGAGGGPAAVYLAFLATYNAHTQSTYRAGYVELPLVQSPGQRLDDLAPYGYDQTHVGLNNLTLAAPRIGLEAERQVGVAKIDATLAFGEYAGSAYGGKPVATGEATYAARPELGLFTRVPVYKGVELFTDSLFGQRAIGVTGQPVFQDAYQRLGFGADAQYRKLDFQAEQWYGHDGDADGVGGQITSSGGYARLRYFPIPHAYLAFRYDAAANPFIVRDWVGYAAAQIYDFRLLIQNVHTIGNGKNFLGGALTVGFPGSLKF